MPPETIKIHEIALYLSIAGVFFTFFFALIFGLQFSAGSSVANTIFSMCTLFTLVPTVILLSIAALGYRRERRLKAIATMLKAYRRIKIAELARKLGITEFKAEQVIAQCIHEGLVTGHIDRVTGEFFTDESLHVTKAGFKCPSCGAHNSAVYLVGESAKCEYCGNLTPEGFRLTQGAGQCQGDGSG